MKKISFFILGCLCVAFVGCDSQTLDWQPATDSVAPGTVSNVSVENRPGGAQISYDLPDDKDLAFVEGVYVIDGKTRRTSASVYTNSLTVEGFGSTSTQTVQLFCVDRSGNYSQAVTAEINPLTPPVSAIFGSIKMNPAFGGVSLEWDNPSQANVSLWLLHKEEDGSVTEVETIYTSASKGSFKLRGLESKPDVYGVYVRDRWNNLSDTLYTELTPLFETEIKYDPKYFKVLRLPRDENDNGQFGRLFDGNLANGMYTTTEVSQSPVFFTFDLGRPVVLSRYILWHRTVGVYGNCSPKIWKLYGTLEPDMSHQDTEYWVNGYQKDWILLSDVNDIAMYKPSGSDLMNTDEDNAAAVRGFDLECISTAPVRYLRFEVTENWAMPVRMVVGELAIYGSLAE